MSIKYDLTLVKYTCSVCGKEVTKQGMYVRECLLCFRPLCPSCEKAQLCPEHFNHLTPREQRDLALLTRVQRWLESRAKAYIVSAIIVIFLGMLLGFYLVYQSTSIDTIYVFIIGSVLIISTLFFGALGKNSLLTKFLRSTREIKHIKRKIYTLLAPYVTSGTSSKLAEIPQKLQGDALKGNSYTNLTYICGICGKNVATKSGVWKKLYCHACYLPLCPQCNRAGLCPEDSARFPPQQLQLLQDIYQKFEFWLKRVNRWFNLPVLGYVLIEIGVAGFVVTTVSLLGGWLLTFIGVVSGICTVCFFEIKYRHEYPNLEKVAHAIDTLVQQFLPSQ